MKSLRILTLTLLFSALIAIPGTANAKPELPPCTPGSPVIQTHYLLVPVHINIPDGRAIELHGSAHITLICGIHTGSVDLRLQRHDFLGWNRTHTKKIFEWRTKDQTDRNLAGKHRGFEFFLMTKQFCVGIANWRLRFFGSPGSASDGSKIRPERDFYPSQSGRRFDCRQ